jgi:methyl-accepting chemotaxis protein
MNAVGTLTIQKKLVIGFGVLVVLMGAMGYVAWRNTVTFSDEFSALYHHNLKGSIHLANAERGLWELRFGLPNYLVGDAAGREKIRAATSRWVAQVEENLKAYRATATAGAAAEILAEFDGAWAAYLQTRPQFFALLDADKVQEAQRFRAEQTNPAAAKAVAALARLNEQQNRAGAEKEAAVMQVAGTSRLIALGLVIMALGVGIGLSVAVSQSIARPLGRMAAALEEASGESDLTRRLDDDRQDELGQIARAFNDFLARLHDIIRRVKAAAGDAAAAAGTLSAAAGQLSSGAQEQASALEETAASLEEITGTVKQNADNARQANQLAVGSRDVAEKGGSVVTDAVRSMSEINEASKKIADIITTIDEIAFQTNLLALNAAVEAARAGEQGRGFAVVAAEVRNLAQRSANAAKEIKALIGDSVQKVEVGSDLVNRSGETLGEIVSAVKRVTEIIAEIAAASQEQSSGIDQVNRAVTAMDQVTQTNAAQTEELSSTARSLARQAAELQALVARFKLEDDASPRAHAGESTGPVAAATSAVAAPRPPAHRGPVASPVAAGTPRGTDGFEEF